MVLGNSASSYCANKHFSVLFAPNQEGVGTVQHGEENTLGRPHCNLPELERSLQAEGGPTFYAGE